MLQQKHSYKRVKQLCGINEVARRSRSHEEHIDMFSLTKYYLSAALSTLRHLKIKNKLECGPVSNVMVALSNIGGALCSTPQSLADAHN